MIKVNLLRQSGTKSSSKSATLTNIQVPNMTSGASPLLVRLAVIIIPIVGAYVFGLYNVSVVNSEIQELNKKLTTFDQQIGAIRPDLELIEKLNAEKNKLTTEISNFKTLSKKRYRFVKALDAIQTLIPEKVWLVKVSFKNSTVIAEGRAPEDQFVSSFMENLEQSSVFSNVTWIDSREVNEPQGIVKLFNIQFNMENL
jgi:Tfp pilus assembly protein PilN